MDQGPARPASRARSTQPIAPKPGASGVGPSDAHRAKLAAERIAYENACATMIQPADARWIFALRASGSLQGGKAAVLTPTKRRELIGAAVQAGIREFDANLIIAVVQDAARRGELGHQARALQGIVPSLALVGNARRPAGISKEWRTALIVISTAIVSLASFALLVRWLLVG